jgi:spermidine synthase
MKTRPDSRRLAILLLTWIPWAETGFGEILYEASTPYHHIRVLEEAGLRTLNFDDAMQTRMSVSQPLRGHFEYVEFFFTPWLWNPDLTNVLMLGLGGGSAQRLYQHYAPQVRVDTVEIDSAVVRVAREFFSLSNSANHRINVSDGRVFLRRSETRYDVILADAYVSGRYGTQEFFTLARDHLTTNGVLAYNIVGTLRGEQADLTGALFRTLKSVFPQVYVFPAKESQNVVLVATRARHKVGLESVRWKAAELVRTRRLTLPGYVERVSTFQVQPPANFHRSPLLSDDHAPVEGLAAQGQ